MDLGFCSISLSQNSTVKQNLNKWHFYNLGLIKQFLRDVDWGEMDYLFVDTPPGTSDEHLSIVQYLNQAKITGAVVITTPQVDHTILFQFKLYSNFKVNMYPICICTYVLIVSF